MPFALVIIGLLLIVTGAQDTHVQFGRQLQKEFTGPGNFTYWILAIAIVGALGYSETLRPISRAFMVLIVVGILIANPNFFTELSKALKEGPISPKAVGGKDIVNIPKDTEAAGAYSDAQKNAGTALKYGTKILEFFMGAPAF